MCRFLHLRFEEVFLAQLSEARFELLVGIGRAADTAPHAGTTARTSFQEFVQLPSTKVQFFERGFLTLQEESGTSQVAGATEDDLQRLLHRFVYRPLLKLGDHSKEASIHDAEIEEVEQE